MMLEGPHHREMRKYKGYVLDVKVYHSPPSATSREEQRYIVVRCRGNTDIRDARDTEDLNPSSILPWRDPEPLSMDEQIDQTVNRMEQKIDAYYERREKTLS